MSEDPVTAPPHLGTSDFSHCHFTIDDEQHISEAPSGDNPDRSTWRGARFYGIARFDGARFDESARFTDVRFYADAGFTGVRFTSTAQFTRAQFDDTAWFKNVQFDGEADFDGTQFDGIAWFTSTQFSGPTRFGGARFSAHTEFARARFSDTAWFKSTRFDGEADFDGTQFDGHAEFGSARFDGRAGFVGAHFEKNLRFGPLMADEVQLTQASFVQRVVVEVQADVLLVSDTRFEMGVELRVRHASISMRRTFFGAPSSLSGVPTRFKTITLTVGAGPVQEWIRAWDVSTENVEPVDTSSRRPNLIEKWVPQLLSVQETDVSLLTLSDVDLRWCRFAGAHQLDKLRLEGHGPFNRPPGWQAGWAWPPIWRWTSRRVLAEEHPWRARRRKSGGWTKELPQIETHDDVASIPPERLTVLYRSLRKAFEDAKNEPGAGDFYYGEMEARRHAQPTGRLERALLTAYWLISGYGQRASRALAALVVLICVLFGLLTQFGLSEGAALQRMSGTIPPGGPGQPQTVTLEVKPAPTALPPLDQRWTADRMGRAIRVALGSVVFRDSDQRLTQPGWWTVMAGRAFGPLLLALAALAIRARVKR